MPPKFKLEKGQQGSKKEPAKEYSLEEQQKMLQGYLQIPEQNWETVKYGSHVRYYIKNGDFRRGGFIKQNPLTFPNNGTPKTTMRLQNGFTAGALEWYVDYKELKSLFVKLDAVSLTILQLLAKNIGK